MTDAIPLIINGGPSLRSDDRAKQPAPLPGIRDDLSLMPGPPLENGSPTWTLHDPVKNRFYRVGQLEFEILARWNLGIPDEIVKNVNLETTFEITEDDVHDLKRFLLFNYLLAPGNVETGSRLRAAVMQKRQSRLKWLLNHYLFIRIPLIHPDGFLACTLPVFRFLISPPVLKIFFIIFLLGTFLAIRRWESFINTFQYFFSFKGVIYYIIAIFFAKFIHELGHAYASKYYGLKVPSMGIAFLVLWPVLYTDCSESWKLKSRSSRMKIVVAGTGAEITLAVIATFMWSFLPEGPVKSACFIVATTTWISSLLLNLSPFMRFDGYYFLSDLLDVPNLQERAFFLGKYYIRKLFLGYETAGRESFSPGKEKKMVIYAYSTWIYRAILFTGIALFVYHKFFKALGIFLFFVEITMFLGRPMFVEIKKWGQIRRETGFNRNIIFSLLALLFIIGIITVPWSSRVELPAVFKAEAHVKIFPPFAAQIQEILIKDGQDVKKGDLFFRLDSPKLDHEENISGAKIKVLEARLKRQGTMSMLLEQSQVIEQQLAGAITELDGIEKQKARLDIRAKEDGQIVDFNENLKPGLWVNGKQVLAGLKSMNRAVLEAYIDEEMLSGVKRGDKGRFYMNKRKHTPVEFTVHEIENTSTNILKEPGLASVYGGDIAVKIGDAGELISHKSLYRIILKTDLKINVPHQKIYGIVQLNGKKQSIIKRMWLKVYALLIRESGF